MAKADAVGGGRSKMHGRCKARARARYGVAHQPAPLLRSPLLAIPTVTPGSRSRQAV